MHVSGVCDQSRNGTQPPPVHLCRYSMAGPLDTGSWQGKAQHIPARGHERQPRQRSCNMAWLYANRMRVLVILATAAGALSLTITGPFHGFPSHACDPSDCSGICADQISCSGSGRARSASHAAADLHAEAGRSQQRGGQRDPPHRRGATVRLGTPPTPLCTAHGSRRIFVLQISTPTCIAPWPGRMPVRLTRRPASIDQPGSSAAGGARTSPVLATARLTAHMLTSSAPRQPQQSYSTCVAFAARAVPCRAPVPCGL